MQNSVAIDSVSLAFQVTFLFILQVLCKQEPEEQHNFLIQQKPKDHFNLLHFQGKSSMISVWFIPSYGIMIWPVYASKVLCHL